MPCQSLFLSPSDGVLVVAVHDAVGDMHRVAEAAEQRAAGERLAVGGGGVAEGAAGVIHPVVVLQEDHVVAAEHEALYYFVYRMTQILMDRINAANIYDPDQGDENPGAGYLTVDFTMMKSAFVYGWANILYMEEHPSTSNGPIINSIDTYLDKLTGNYFYATIHYSHNSVSGMTSNACSALDNINLNTSMADATTLSAELMADIVDYYCNGELS